MILGHGVIWSDLVLYIYMGFNLHGNKPWNIGFVFKKYLQNFSYYPIKSYFIIYKILNSITHIKLKKNFKY